MNKITEQEKNRRIKLAQAYLAEIGNSQTFRKHIEIAEKGGTLEDFWKLQDKLSRELANHLINYKGSSEATYFCLRLADILNGIEYPEEKWFRVRESIKEFLNHDEDIIKSELLNDLAMEAVAENTMDGYYNLLKNFRKNIEELEKIKGGEENTNSFLEKMTDVVYDRKSGTTLKNYG